MSFPHRSKRRLTVQDHADWLHSNLTSDDLDEIEEVIPDFGPPVMRKEGEVRKVLDLLDEIGKDGNE